MREDDGVDEMAVKQANSRCVFKIEMTVCPDGFNVGGRKREKPRTSTRL